MVLNKHIIGFMLFVLATICPRVEAQKRSFPSFDGTEIVYDDEGNGEVVLLVHGFINSRKSWDKTVLKRALLAGGYRIIAPDLRGNGDSDKPQDDEGYSNNAEVRDLKLLMEHIQVKSYMAVGYSRGSIVLANLLTKDKYITKAVLGGMGLDFANPDWDRRIMFGKAFDGQTNEITQGAVDYAKSIHADLRSLHLQQKHQPVTSITELQMIKSRVLVIAGDEDTDNGAPQDLNEAIPGSVLKIVPGNHNGTYKTEDFSKTILDFLK